MSHVRTLLSAATALVAAAALAGPADAHPDRPTPGAPGIGDPYFPTEGNGGYDVRHYGIALDYRPATDLLRATTTISARATQALSSFNLDLHGLTVRSVRVDGDRARFSRSGDEMTVTPRRPLKDHARFRVVVSYSGVPQAIDDPQLGLNGWINTDDGALVAGQPYGAATWFPVNDHPLDKATYSIRATVPRGLETVANGRLVSRRSAGGSTTWRYEATDPMASYLATVDIGEFDLTARTVAGIHYLDALDPDLDPAIAARIRASLAREPEIVGFLSSQFGRYPWRESGAIIDDLRIGFALETQTRPVYSFLFWGRDQAGGDSVVVHELAHQWYGDSVAVARWQDIWLNEGFATYAEWLWGEHEGRFTPQQAYDDLLAGIPADDDFWQLAIGDPGPDHLFDGPVYDRGAMTLQALRNRIGDRTFFTLLRRWASEHRDGHGTTPAFIALAERLSRQQLDDLFDVWLSAGYPGGAAASSRPAGRATTGLPAALAAHSLRR